MIKKRLLAFALCFIMPVFPSDILNDAYTYNEQLFAEEDAVITETIDTSDIINMQMDSIYASVVVEASPDDDIHLKYPERSSFTPIYETTDGTLIISMEANNPNNYDVLKVGIPLDTIERLDILGGASLVRVAGQEGLLREINIEMALGTVFLENIYADANIKMETGTIQLENDSVQSNIHLSSKNGVIDVSLGELPDDVSLYIQGNNVQNTLLDDRDSVSTDEKYTLILENSVGGINIHGK